MKNQGVWGDPYLPNWPKIASENKEKRRAGKFCVQDLKEGVCTIKKGASSPASQLTHIWGRWGRGLERVRPKTCQQTVKNGVRLFIIGHFSIICFYSSPGN